MLWDETNQTYLIYTADGLKAFRDMVNGGKTSVNAKLMNDITLNDGIFDDDGNWSESGTPDEWSPIKTFSGTFDGNGHSINGVYVNNAVNAGLFDSLRGGADVKNLTVSGYICAKAVNGNSYAGGIASIIDGNAKITDCINNATIKARINNDVDYGYEACAGGMAGYVNGNAKITGCTNNGNVVSNSYMANAFTGGMAGCICIYNNVNDNAVVENCLNNAALSAKTYCSRFLSDGTTEPDHVTALAYSGGMVGYTIHTNFIGCYNTGAVTANTTGDVARQAVSGGIVGVFQTYGYNTVIINCGNTGKLRADGFYSYNAYIGGIVGSAAAFNSGNLDISCCYSTGNIEQRGVGIGGVAGVLTSSNGVLTVSHCYWLTESCDTGISYYQANKVFVTDILAKDKTDFADGTVLGLLKQNDTTNAWSSDGYVDAAGMTLPLLKWQTAESHICVFDEQKYNDTEHWMECSCGIIDPNSKASHTPKNGNCTDGIKCECGYEMIPPTSEHNWSKWTHVLTTHTRQCKNQYCDIVETKDCKDNNSDHNCDVCGGVLTICADNDNDHKCDLCGKVVSTCVDNDKDHNCDICDKVLSQHSGGKATCKEKAMCEYCGKEYGDFDKLNHTGGTEIKNRYSSSCSSSGYSGDEYCLGCGELIKKGYSTSSSGHYGGTATCKDKAKCLSCGSEYGETDPSNHSNLMYVAPKEATHKKNGNTEYWYCDGCNKYFADANAKSEISQSDTVVAKLAKAKSDNDNTDNKATDETATVKNSSSKKSPLTGSNYSLLPPAMIALGIALLFIKKKKQTEI